MDFFEPGLAQGNIIASVALVIFLVAASRARNILDVQGTLAAAGLGLVVGVGGHWTWLIVLLAFLLLGFFATRYRFEEKAAAGLEESDTGERAWTNVIANGGIPGIVALAALLLDDHSTLAPVFAAAVAVAAADTFASEFGCLDPRVWMITTMRRCERGLNGGFSITGQAAALAGGLLTGGITWCLTALLPAMVQGGGDLTASLVLIPAVAGVGFIGCQIDSLLGATLENRGLIGKGTVNALSIGLGCIIAWQTFPMLGV